MVERLNLLTGKKLKETDLTCYSLPKLYGIKRNTFNLVLKQIDYSKLPEIIGSIYSLHRLSIEGHEIHFISHRNAKWGIKKETKDWFRLKGITKYNSLKLTGNKVRRAKRLKLEMMLEDSPEQALKFIGNNIPVILFDYTYNKHIKSDLIYRVNNWYEAMEVINDYSRLKERQG